MIGCHSYLFVVLKCRCTYLECLCHHLRSSVCVFVVVHLGKDVSCFRLYWRDTTIFNPVTTGTQFPLTTDLPRAPRGPSQDKELHPRPPGLTQAKHFWMDWDRNLKHVNGHTYTKKLCFKSKPLLWWKEPWRPYNLTHERGIEWRGGENTRQQDRQRR